MVIKSICGHKRLFLNKLNVCVNVCLLSSSMDYATELKELLKQQPELRQEAQRIFFEGAVDLDDFEHPNVKMNSYERIYKALKSIADKQGLAA